MRHHSVGGKVTKPTRTEATTMISSTSRRKIQDAALKDMKQIDQKSMQQGQESASDVKLKKYEMMLNFKNQMTGQVLFSLILVVAAAYPFALPQLFIVLTIVAMSIRMYDYWFVQPRKIYFLLDFCYMVNAACCGYLLLPSSFQNPRIDAVLYALADGPVAFALYCWSFPWIMWSQEYYITVLIHVLPGLAMYAHHHLPRLSSWSQIASCASLLQTGKTVLRFSGCIIDNADDTNHGPMPGHWMAISSIWLIAVPLLWVFVHLVCYFAMVHLIFQKKIDKDDCYTSLTVFYVLEKRHKGNPWARVALRTFVGSKLRRMLTYGFWMMLSSFLSLLVFTPSYYSWHIASMYQIGKILLPLHKGIKLTCKMSKSMIIEN